MIRAIFLEAENGSSVILNLSDPWSAGVAVLKAEGLGPVNSDIFVANYGARSGGYYNGSRAVTRNITLTLKPVGLDLERVRRRLYNVLPVQERIKITVITDHVEVETVGYVESFEPDIFSNYSTYIVSLICPDPFFTETGSLITTTETLSSVGPLFEFPFSNPIFAPEIEFSRTLPDWQFYITYTGQVPVGMILRITLDTLPGNEIVVKGPRGSYLKVRNTGVMQVGGVLTIVSETGRRSVKYTSPAGTVTDLAWTTWEQGDWPMLYPGENSLIIFNSARSAYTAVIEYTKKYLGV